MTRNQLTFTSQLQLIVALRYNHIFQKEIDLLRNKYGIPKELTKALEWLKQYEGKYLKKEESTFDVPISLDNINLDYLNELREEVNASIKSDQDDYYKISNWQSPSNIKWTARENRIMIYKDEHLKENHLYTLDEDIYRIMTRFRIPQYMEYLIKRYLISNNTEWLSPDFLAPYVTLDISIKESLPRMVVTIYGIYPWNTKEQWNDIWDKEIMPRLRETMSDDENYIKWESAKKRRTLISLVKQIERYAQWYSMVEIENLPLKIALERWMEAHEEDRGKYDESTVSKAISTFRDIITPKFDNS